MVFTRTLFAVALKTWLDLDKRLTTTDIRTVNITSLKCITPMRQTASYDYTVIIITVASVYSFSNFIRLIADAARARCLVKPAVALR